MKMEPPGCRTGPLISAVGFANQRGSERSIIRIQPLRRMIPLICVNVTPKGTTSSPEGLQVQELEFISKGLKMSPRNPIHTSRELFSTRNLPFVTETLKLPSQQERIHAHSFVLGPELRIQYTYTYMKDAEHDRF